MADEVRGAMPGPVAVGGTPSAAVIDPTNQGKIPAAQPGNEPQKPWSVGDPDLDKVIAAKGWKTDKDALKSYTEIESKFGTISQEHKQLMEFYKMVHPYLSDFDAFLAAKSETEGKAGKQKTEIPKEVSDWMKSTEARLAQNTEQSWAHARVWAEDRFTRQYPEAEQYAKEIEQKFKRGDVRIENPADPNDLFRSLENALKLVRQDVVEKEEKGRKAASVEGGSGNGPTGQTLRGMSLDQKREMLRTGQV